MLAIRSAVCALFMAVAMVFVLPGSRSKAQGTGPCFDASVDCAPAGFNNQTNGFEPQAQFDEDRAAFDETEFVEDNPQNDQEGGLGPVYNSTSCVACHQNAGFVTKRPVIRISDAVSGTSSQVAEIRAGHNERTTTGTLLFQEAPGGSVIQQRAIDPKVQELVPDRENIRARRLATSVLGDGFVEAIGDEDLIRVRSRQRQDVRGRANVVPVVVEPVIKDGKIVDFIFSSRIGRFGWKAQEASLLNFAAGAYVAEMGITSELQRLENSSLGRSVEDFDIVDDPEDEAVITPKSGEQPHPFGEDVEAFTRFMRSTMAPPQADATAEPGRVARGRSIFGKIGCAECHHPSFTTAAEGIQFGDLKLPKALAGKTIFPYSDFLLHDIGTGDGIVQTQYAERPPTGLVTATSEAPRAAADLPLPQRNVNVSIDFDRLNALLRGQPDPKYPRNGFAGVQTANLLPAIQVRDPQTTALRAVNGRAARPQVGGRSERIALLYTADTAQLIRTAPLWGLRTRPQLLHDGRALTIRGAIRAHRRQAERARAAFGRLSGTDQQLVLDFLNFL
jgi:CxxC motif-containing protein (DUF1111 family)